MSQDKLVLVASGGTIAGYRDDSGRWQLHSGAELLSQAPALEELSPVVVDDVFRAPSTKLSLDDMTHLAVQVRSHLADDTVSGAIVTHGTDSLEESAYLADLLVESSKPVVFTGAMRNSSEYGADGPRNLYAAALTALSPYARGEGVLVVMNDRVYAAHDVTKTDSKNPASFDSIPFGPLAYLEQNRVIWGRKRLPMYRFPNVTALEKRVELVKLAAGMEGTLVDLAVSNGTRAIVLETLGAGAIPPGVYPALERARRHGVDVILTTRCVSGTVNSSRGRDFIVAGDLRGPKARILAMVALAEGAGVTLAEAFEQPGLTEFTQS